MKKSLEISAGALEPAFAHSAAVEPQALSGNRWPQALSAEALPAGVERRLSQVSRDVTHLAVEVSMLSKRLKMLLSTDVDTGIIE